MNEIRGFHHVTAGVGGAQEDVDFYHGVLGQALVKRTVLLDGTSPIYHLYYGNPRAELGTINTSFPFRQKGVKARRGSGQAKVLAYSVPLGALSFWRDRFARLGVDHDARETELFGDQRLRFRHPCGVELDLVETASDIRAPCESDGIDASVAIRGLHSAILSLRDVAESITYMQDGLGFSCVKQSGSHYRLEVNGGGAGRIVDFLHEPDVAQGSSIYGEGTIHHIAFAVDDVDAQMAIKERLMGLGYIDVTESLDRNYFRSIYTRLPGGPIIEMATRAPGFTIDEPADRLGQVVQLPPHLAPRKDEFLSRLEPIRA